MHPKVSRDGSAIAFYEVDRKTVPATEPEPNRGLIETPVSEAWVFSRNFSGPCTLREPIKDIIKLARLNRSDLVARAPRTYADQSSIRREDVFGRLCAGSADRSALRRRVARKLEQTFFRFQCFIFCPLDLTLGSVVVSPLGRFPIRVVASDLGKPDALHLDLQRIEACMEGVLSSSHLAGSVIWLE